MERAERLYRAMVADARTPPWLARALKLAAVTARELARDQVPVRAATLAYWTLVALVPLMVVMAGVLRLAGVQYEGMQALGWRVVLAGSVTPVGQALDELVAQVDLAKLSVVGLVVVLWAGSRIYFSVEAAYNALWATRIRRSLPVRIAVFYTTVTLGPVLLAAGIVASARLHLGIDPSVTDRALPVAASLVAFLAMLRALPDTTVRWGPALAGAALSAVLFELAKAGFGAYVGLVSKSGTQAAIYGSLAFFPLFLLWLQLAWLIVLLGVEVAFVIQRRDDLLDAEERALAGPGRRRPDALFALRCMLVVGRRFGEGSGPSKERDVTHALGCDPAHAWEALEILEEAGLLAESPAGYLPTRLPTEVTAREVLERVGSLTRPQVRPGAPGESLVAEAYLDAARLQRPLSELA